MDPIKTIPKEKDKVVDVRQVELEKKEVFFGRLRQRKGHTLYEVNLSDQSISHAKFEDTETIEGRFGAPNKPQGIGIKIFGDGSKKVVLDALPDMTRKLIRKRNCIYISALNRKNLIKKLIKKGLVKLKKD